MFAGCSPAGRTRNVHSVARCDGRLDGAHRRRTFEQRGDRSGHRHARRSGHRTHHRTALRKALLCQRAEHKFAGVPCGIMDQFIAVGTQRDHAMLLDCLAMTFELIPLASHDVTVLIINSQVKHSLATGEYAKRQADCHEAARLLGIRDLRDATMEKLRAAEDRMPSEVFRRCGT